MQSVLQPYATAGVAIVGASLIAVTPVVAPLPDIHTVRDVALTAGDAADASPLGDLLAPWVDQYNTAADNASVLANNFLLAPGVGLQQALANQADFANDVLQDPSSIPTVVNQMQENVNAVLSAFTLLNASDDTLATTTLHTLSGSTGLDNLGHDALLALLPLILPSVVPADEVATVTSIVDFLGSPLSGIIMGALGPILSPVVGLMNSISDGDSFNETLANTVGAFFNGATLNLDSLIPVIDQAGVLPAGISFEHLDFALGGLLSAGEVGNAPYTLFASNGDTVAEVPAVGGSILNAVGIDLTGVPLLGSLDIASHAVGPIGAWEAWSQAVAGLLGADAWNWSAKNNPGVPPPPASPPLTGASFPLINPDFFGDGDDGGAGSAAATELSDALNQLLSGGLSDLF